MNTITSKRAFDFTVASILLLVLSPVFLIIAIAIRTESKGPIFYTSKRVGEGWRVFDFFKFRTMRVDADSLLKDIAHLNAYDNDSDDNPTTNEQISAALSGAMLIGDEGWISEAELQQTIAKTSFLKVENDPRITPIGHFLRNSSLDELPQLLNVVRGDMSLVGNRPLPLYEAETLTNDSDAERFLAPAGITGLWQITERGGAEVSEARRKQLDVEYARLASFWYDLKILWKTLPAASQSVNA